MDNVFRCSTSAGFGESVHSLHDPYLLDESEEKPGINFITFVQGFEKRAEHVSSTDLDKGKTKKGSGDSSEKNPGVVYTIKVTNKISKDSYYIFKSYEQFQSLYRAIIFKFSELEQMIEFPKKGWFFEKYSIERLHERVILFGDFLHTLISNVKYYKDSMVENFLKKNPNDINDALVFYRLKLNHLRNSTKGIDPDYKNELSETQQMLQELTQSGSNNVRGKNRRNKNQKRTKKPPNRRKNKNNIEIVIHK